jgi:hypothetical protein
MSTMTRPGDPPAPDSEMRPAADFQTARKDGNGGQS